MARICEALDSRDALPDFLDGVEVVLLSNSLGYLPEQGISERHNNLTILLNLSHEDSDRRVIRDAGFRLNGIPHVHHVFHGDSWEQELRHRVSAYPAGRINVVVLLPRVGPHDDESLRKTPRRALEVMLDDSPHTEGLMIAVTERMYFWKGLHKVMGYVEPRAAGRAYDANALFAHLSTLMAPMLVVDCDLADLFDSFGVAEPTPSVVAIASWNLETRQLAFQYAGDLALVMAGKALSVSPLWAEGSWKDSHELMTQLRQSLASDAEYVYIISSNFFRPSSSVLGSRCVPVVIVVQIDWGRCKLLSAADVESTPTKKGERGVG